MKLLTLLPLMLVLMGCKDAQKNAPGKQIRGNVDADAAHSYELYLPRGYDSTRSYPLIVSIDSHGSGSTAIRGFEAGADDYGFIVVGSNLVKNGMNDYSARIGELVADVKAKRKINERAVVMAGFSGGARMAIHQGVQSAAAGIIACGASVAYQNIQQMLNNTFLYNIAGTQDFNLRESSYAAGADECSASNYYSNTFVGTHQWPPVAKIYDAVEFAYVKLASGKIIDATVDVGDVGKKLEERADSLVKSGRAMDAYKVAERGAKMFRGESAGEDFSEIMERASKDEHFAREQAEVEQNLRFEQMLCEGYVSSIDKDNLGWWKRELDALSDTIKSHKPGTFLDMLMRSKGFIGILCFAKTNVAAQGTDVISLKRYLDIYQAAEPQNPDMFYFKAVYMAKTNRRDSVKIYLDKAVLNGYADTSRLKNEFGYTR